MPAPRNRKDEAPVRAGRRPRLTAAARAQAQRDAFSRRVARRHEHIQRYGVPQLLTDVVPEEQRERRTGALLRRWYQEITRYPIKGVNRVTGMIYFK